MHDSAFPESRLVSINVGLPRATGYRGKQIQTGIYKAPIAGPVLVRRLNHDGDAQADLTVHGGVDKAVYLYAAENYDLWQSELDHEVPYGQFGENLTTDGLLEPGVHVGDELEIGEVVLQVTQPRFPCFKLGIKMGSQRFLVQFLRSGRSGFYCRVLQEGRIEAGQPIRLLARSLDQPTIAELVTDFRREHGVA